MIDRYEMGLKGPGIAMFASNILVGTIQWLWSTRTEPEFEREDLPVFEFKGFTAYLSVGSASVFNQLIQFIALEVIFLLAVKFSIAQ